MMPPGITPLGTDVRVVPRPYFVPFQVNGGTTRTVILLPSDNPAGVEGELTRYIFNCLLQ